MSSEDDGGLAGCVSMGQISVPLVLAVVRVSVSTVGRGRVEAVGWAEGVFGQQLVMQVQICTVSGDTKKNKEMSYTPYGECLLSNIP